MFDDMVIVSKFKGISFEFCYITNEKGGFSLSFIVDGYWYDRVTHVRRFFF